MSELAILARMLGLSEANAGESLTSERAARHVISRRGVLGLGALLAAAMCTGTAYAMASEPAGQWIVNGRLISWARVEINVGGYILGNLRCIQYDSDDLLAGDIVALDVSSGKLVRAQVFEAPFGRVVETGRV